MNDLYVKHSGYVADIMPNIATYFSMSTARFIAAKVSELLLPYHPRGVIVPVDKVINVMNAVYADYRPATGDIFSRYTIPSDENHNAIDEMINQVVTIIVNDVKNHLETETTNSQLTVWTSVYGAFNEHGLRAHPPIKLREKRPQTMLFNMNY